MLIYRCPKSGKTVRTSIETTGKEIRRLASFKLSVWCPHCQDAHTIFGKDASVSSADLSAAA
jgi:ribosomal protein S27E